MEREREKEINFPMHCSTYFHCATGTNTTVESGPVTAIVYTKSKMKMGKKEIPNGKRIDQEKNDL